MKLAQRTALVTGASRGIGRAMALALAKGAAAKGMTVNAVARSCIDLCSADGDYMTGSELKMNAGLYM